MLLWGQEATQTFRHPPGHHSKHNQGSCVIVVRQMKTQATGACSSYFLGCSFAQTGGETLAATEWKTVQPHLPPPCWAWPSNHSLPAASQVSHPYNAGLGNAVTSLTTELQRTCPLRVPGGVQELLSGCLTQSCCPSFGVPRPQSLSPEPRFPVGRDMLYCS